MSAPSAADLTVEEQAALVTGATFWRTAAVDRVGMRGLLLVDGPHGVRRQLDEHSLGVGGSAPATCFPPAVAVAATFDVELAERVGRALARETRAQGADVLLGPGLNLKRSPLGGRNFEYYSEDPWLSGRLAAAMVIGIQGEGVAACPKHFAVNNQETDRLRVSAEVDERTLHELYLRSFRHVVQRARPWSMMSAYNAVNGVPASENRLLLTEILRDDWGFDGVVISDWGAVGDRVRAAEAGLDLQMPADAGHGARRIRQALDDGSLDPGVLETAADRVLTLHERVTATLATPPDVDEHHALAREVATRAIVLLRNDGDLLPLPPGRDIALLGALATEWRVQGGGSSRVNPFRVDGLVESLSSAVGGVRVAAGYRLDDVRDDLLRADAVALAASAASTVLVLGLPEHAEAEGVDRTTLALPVEQLRLLDEVSAVTDRLVVVVVAGGVVDLEPVRAPALLAAGLLGQAGAGALVDVLTGAVSPSGRLAETVPRRLSDVPSSLEFPGAGGSTRHSEGLFVGYRGHDALGHEVEFPFGHGLSYTSFDYGPLVVEVTPSEVIARTSVRNTGARRGREIVQVYAGVDGSRVVRVPRQLCGVAVVDLERGEERVVEVRVPIDELRYWEVGAGWRLEEATYRFWVGASSRDLRGEAAVELGDRRPESAVSTGSTIAELMARPEIRERFTRILLERVGAAVAEDVVGESGWAVMMGSFPFDRVARWPGLELDDTAITWIVSGAGESPAAV